MWNSLVSPESFVYNFCNVGYFAFMHIIRQYSHNVSFIHVFNRLQQCFGRALFICHEEVAEMWKFRNVGFFKISYVRQNERTNFLFKIQLRLSTSHFLFWLSVGSGDSHQTRSTRICFHITANELRPLRQVWFKFLF